MTSKFFNSKIFIAVIFFCLGFLVNHGFNKLLFTQRVSLERFPVDIDDFDHEKIMETMLRESQSKASRFHGASTLGMIDKNEDDKNVYYEIPLNEDLGENHKINVEIKNGFINISEKFKDNSNGNIETSSERVFSIESHLDSSRAEIIHNKNKIIVRIPKKRK